jgi:seryl-tRNA synthetase
VQEIYLSGRELGEYIDKPVRTIENWAAAHHIKQDDKGKYGLISTFKHQLATITEKLERSEQRLEEAQADRNEVKLLAGQRKLIAEADKEEAIAAIKQLELKKLQGELVNAEEVHAVLSDYVSKARAKFINIPAKMALELSGLEPQGIQARLTTVIDEALIELGSQYGSRSQ